MKNVLVRGAAAVTGSALVFGLALAGPQAHAAPITKPTGADPAPAALGAAYLAAQPGADGIIDYYFGGVSSPFPGLSIDAAVSLDAVGAQPAAVNTVANAIETSSYPTSGAAAAAKFAEFEHTLGRTSAALAPAIDLVNDAIATAAPITGRLESGTTPDYTAPLDQGYAAAALTRAGESNADEALAFLLDQQCAAGFFRASFTDDKTAPAPEQTCDGADAAEQGPSVDTTAFTVLNLQSIKSATGVSASLQAAVAWLLSQQAPNGSFEGNANSTGLAGWALGVSGRADAAAKAASWLRAHQLANAGSCAKFAVKDNGAITSDDLAYSNAAAGPLSNDDNSTATYATAQALPALLWAPGGTAAGQVRLTAPEFARAGSTQVVSLNGAPGDTVCVTVGTTVTRVVLAANGTATVPVPLPSTTSRVAVSSVDAGGETDALVVNGLAKAKLKSKVADRVKVGTKFKVKVKGLAPGEPVKITYRNQKKKVEANAKGVVKIKLKATKVGKAKVKIRGAFADRKAAEKVTVVR